MKRELTCIICPLGCSLSATIEDGKVVFVEGNTCKRGKSYAEVECIAPVRTLTTTVMSNQNIPVACKTETPIPKEKLFSAMKIINTVKIDLPIRIGDVIIEDVFGSRLIATENIDIAKGEDF